MILLIKAHLYIPFCEPKKIKFWCNEQDNYKKYFEDLIKFSAYSKIKYLEISSVPRGIETGEFGYVYYMAVR